MDDHDQPTGDEARPGNESERPGEAEVDASSGNGEEEPPQPGDGRPGGGDPAGAPRGGPGHGPSAQAFGGPGTQDARERHQDPGQARTHPEESSPDDVGEAPNGKGDRDENVQVVDRRSDLGGQRPAQPPAEDAPGRSPGRGQDQDLGQERGGELGPARSERAKDRGVAAAGDRRERGGIEDQENADEEGHEGQGLEVEGEAGQHLGEEPLALPLGADDAAALPARPEPGLVDEGEVHAVHPAAKAEPLLGLSDIHQDERLSSRVGEGSEDEKRASRGRDPIAGRDPGRPGQAGVDENRVGIGQEGNRRRIAGIRSHLSESRPKEPVEERLDPEQAGLDAPGDPDPTVDHRTEGVDRGIGGEVLQDALIERPGGIFE